MAGSRHQEHPIDTPAFPPLPAAFEPTRATLAAYARAMGAVPRAHGIAHPRWWHISLKMLPDGMVTDAIPLPGGGSLRLRMDLRAHEIVAEGSDGAEDRFDMRAGATGTAMGDQILAAAARLGLDDRLDRTRFENDDPRAYHPAAAAAYLDAFTTAQAVFERHRAAIGGPVGPIQVWPHGFDLAFEWFGGRAEDHDGAEATAQLNLGFYPGGDPYFYSSPWPFDPVLLGVALPHGAVWNTEWNGAALPYAVVEGRADGAAKVAGFARAVFEAAAPTLRGDGGDPTLRRDG